MRHATVLVSLDEGIQQPHRVVPGHQRMYNTTVLSLFLLLASQVLQDAARRRQYDAARSATSSGPFSGYSGEHSGAAGGFQPGVDSDDFEEAFRKFWEKAGGKCARSSMLT